MVLIAVAVAGYLVVDRKRDADLRAALTGGTCTTDDRSDDTGPPGQNHIPNPTYRVDPPAGGNHEPSAVRSGVYAGTNIPSNGKLVHSLEHGYVIFWHRPDISEDDRRTLQDLQGRYSGDVLLVERTSLPVPVAATAWTRRLLCQQVEEGPLVRFVEEYVGDGPEDVERG